MPKNKRMPELVCKNWLVEIKMFTRAASITNNGVHICYEEVLATDEKMALNLGFDQFSDRAKYEPATRNKLQKLCLSVANCYASEAVEV